MLTLGGAGIEYRGFADESTKLVVRVSEDTRRITPLRKNEAFLARSGDEIPKGFGTYLMLRRDVGVLSSIATDARTAILPDKYEYLGDGDVVRLQPARKEMRTLSSAKVRPEFLFTHGALQ